MTHDPFCEWSTPCIHGENQNHSRDTENLAVPDATYCWMCGVDCTCDLIAKVRQDQCSVCCTQKDTDINAAENLAYERGVKAGYTARLMDIDDLIRKAREDERNIVTAEFMSNHGDRWEYGAGVAAGRAEALGIRVREVMPYANGYFDGEDHMLAKAIACIPHEDDCCLRWAVDDDEECDCHALAVVAALRALEEKP